MTESTEFILKTHLGDKIEGDSTCERINNCACSSDYENDSGESTSSCGSCASLDGDEMYGYLSHYHVRLLCKRCDFEHYPCYPCYRSRSQYMQIVINKKDAHTLNGMRSNWRLDIVFKDLIIIFVFFETNRETFVIEDIFPPFTVSVTGIKDTSKFISVVNHMLKYDVRGTEISKGGRPEFLKAINF